MLGVVVVEIFFFFVSNTLSYRSICAVYVLYGDGERNTDLYVFHKRLQSNPDYFN